MAAIEERAVAVEHAVGAAIEELWRVAMSAPSNFRQEIVLDLVATLRGNLATHGKELRETLQKETAEESAQRLAQVVNAIHTVGERLK